MFCKKHVIASLLGCTATAFFFAACSDDSSSGPSPEESAIQKMSIREKVGQMFFARMESLEGNLDGLKRYTEEVVKPQLSEADVRSQKMRRTLKGVITVLIICCVALLCYVVYTVYQQIN